MSAIQLRPWQMGELIDRSTSFWRRRLKQLFQLMLGFQLVLFVLQKAYVLAGQKWFPALLSARALTEAQQGGNEAILTQVGIGSAVMFVMLPTWIFISWAANVALSRFIVDDVVGRGGDFRVSLQRLRKRVGTLLGAFVIVHLWLAAVLVVATLPGAAVIAIGIVAGSQAALFGAIIGGYSLMAFCWIAVSLWYFLRFLLVPTVIAVEERPVFGTIRRAGELISGRIGTGFLNRVFVRATIVVTIIFVVLLVVTLVMSIPQGILQLIFGNILDPRNATPEAVPQLLLIPAELFEAVGASLIVPLSAVLASLFYLDMRMRREGLDLELKLNASEPKA